MTSSGTADFPSSSLAKNVVTGLSKISLAIKTSAWQEGSRAGLTPTQAQALVLLRRGGASRLGELAEELGVRSSTASDAISALMAKGLLRKKRAAEDPRALAIELTDRGQAKAAEAANWPDFLIEAVEALDQEEQRVLLRALAKMIKRLQDLGRIPVARMCVTCKFFQPYAHDDPWRPHHCHFVDAPFGDHQLRLDCPDHQEALRRRELEAFLGSSEPKSER